jgi:predicted lipoprotein with Yx(FWY)xxD motif
MNQYTKILAVVVVVLVALYGGYRLYHHFTWKPPAAAPVVATPTKSPVMTPAMQNSVYKMMSNSKTGNYLTDGKGMALYTYSKDAIGVSNCSGLCIAKWPAYGPKTEPTSLPSNIIVITRLDKSLQYAWKGMPLYYFVSDLKAGDVNGDGVGGFTLAK